MAAEQLRSAQSPPPKPDADSPAKPGDLLRGRYLLQNVIGRGGMGTVFEAIDQFKLDLPNADRRLAIKVLNRAVCERPELLAELRREFQNIQALAHPNIVRAFEYDRDGERSFFTMEFLSGLSLSRVLAARQELPLDRSQALSILRDTGSALAYAHSRRVVHGDLNPANIFLTDDGDVRVLDFGGAWLSESGTRLATPRYASCQVLEGNPPEVRDDVYSFACVLYWMLTGHHAFGERTAIEARSARARPRRPKGLSGQAWLALRAALSFEREQRPEDIAEWLKSFDLGAAVNHLPPLIGLLRAPPRASRRPILSLAVAMLLLAIGGLLGWLLTNPEPLRGVLGTLPDRAADLSHTSRDWLSDAGARISQWSKRSSAEQPAASNAPIPSEVEPPPAAAPPSTASTGVAPAAQEPPAVEGPPAAPGPGSAQARASAQGPGSAQGRASAEVPSERRDARALPPASAAGAAAAHAPPAAPAPPSAAHTAPAKIEFAASTIEVPPSEPSALVLVRRNGNTQSDASFSWWTESGSAKPGEDFSPVAPHVEHFAKGESSLRLSIPLATDTTRRQPRSFYVVLSDPSQGAVLGDRSLAMVTLPPAETSATAP
jgi:serine/threonine protein kinase